MPLANSFQLDYNSILSSAKKKKEVVFAVTYLEKMGRSGFFYHYFFFLNPDN